MVYSLPFSLSLRFPNVVSPNVSFSDGEYNIVLDSLGVWCIHAMPANEYRIRVGMLVHGYLEAARKVFFTVQVSTLGKRKPHLNLLRSILNDRNSQSVVIPEHTYLSLSSGNALDLLNLLNLKCSLRYTLSRFFCVSLD